MATVLHPSNRHTHLIGRLGSSARSRVASLRPQRTLLPIDSPLRPHVTVFYSRLSTSSLPPRAGSKAPRFRTTAKVGIAAAVISISAVTLGVSFGAARKRNGTPSSAEQGPLSHLTLAQLFRRYFVYACCSSATLVEWSPALIDWSQGSSLPFVRSLSQWVMLHTFFPQFVAGQTANKCTDVVRQNSERGVGAIFAYSAEADLSKASVHKETNHQLQDEGRQGIPGMSAAKEDSLAPYLFMDKVLECYNSIRVAAELNKEEREVRSLKTLYMPAANTSTPTRSNNFLIAVKLSGLLRDPHVLERASAALLPREHFSEPPITSPTVATSVASGASPGLMIPVASLGDDDVKALKALWTALQGFAQYAQDNERIRLLIDAEYSWYQPAIDAFFESCARQFNRLPRNDASSGLSRWLPFVGSSPQFQRGTQLPLIYNTYQAYLRRTPAYLAMSLERANAGNYSIGAKLVRGAYMEVENELAPGTTVKLPPGMDSAATEATHTAERGEWRSPVWPSKALTDDSYNACAQLLVSCVRDNILDGNSGNSPVVGVVIAGHNWRSASVVVDQMIRDGLAIDSATQGALSHKTPGSLIRPPGSLQLMEGVRGKLHLAQLHGMADDLTNAIRCAFDPTSGGDGPHIALKYIPYGDLALTMPYLTRRAQENKSVLGEGMAKHEREMVTAELWQRFTAIFSR